MISRTFINSFKLHAEEVLEPLKRGELSLEAYRDLCNELLLSPKAQEEQMFCSLIYMLITSRDNLQFTSFVDTFNFMYGESLNWSEYIIFSDILRSYSQTMADDMYRYGCQEFKIASAPYSTSLVDFIETARVTIKNTNELNITHAILTAACKQYGISSVVSTLYENLQKVEFTEDEHNNALQVFARFTEPLEIQFCLGIVLVCFREAPCVCRRLEDIITLQLLDASEALDMICSLGMVDRWGVEPFFIDELCIKIYRQTPSISNACMCLRILCRHPELNHGTIKDILDSIDKHPDISPKDQHIITTMIPRLAHSPDSDWKQLAQITMRNALRNQ